MTKASLQKLRDFVERRVTSGISPETISLDLITALPKVLTRAHFKVLRLPWMCLPIAATSTESLSATIEELVA
jgi:hypothetical protein